jgi:hypothetical protein
MLLLTFPPDMNTPKLVNHGAMLVITSKVQQKLGAYQLLVKNMTSLFWSSVNGIDWFLLLHIRAMFKQSTIHNNVFKNLFLRNAIAPGLLDQQF